MKFSVGDKVAFASDPNITGEVKNVHTPAGLSAAYFSYLILWDNGNVTREREDNLVSSSNKPKTSKKSKITMDSVILEHSKKEQIRSAISQIENTKQIFDDWGFGEVFEKGTAVTLLFYGTPGTGKTLMAQAVAEELGMDLKIYGTAEIQSSEPGGAERTIKKIFKEAQEFFTKNKKNQVVLFDECDSLLYDRNKVGVIMAAQINTLLSEIERHSGVIIFTTNRMGRLDPALERRITTKIEFPFPDKKEREAIWKRMIPPQAPISNKVNFEKLSEYPLAGGNIKNVVLNAARMAAYQKSDAITMKNFVDAIEKEAESLQAFISEYNDVNTISEEGVLDRGDSEINIKLNDKTKR